MTLLAPTLEAFFTERLGRPAPGQPRHHRLPTATPGGCYWCSPSALARSPSSSTSPTSTPPRFGAFLEHLETRAAQYRCAPGTPGWRPSALPSSSPPCAIPSMPTSLPEYSPSPRRSIGQATSSPASPQPEVSSPARRTGHQPPGHGRRDHALLALAAQTGLRGLSELTGLTRGDVQPRRPGRTVSLPRQGPQGPRSPRSPRTSPSVIRTWLRRAARPIR